MLGAMIGKYASFAELDQHEMQGRDYSVRAVDRPGSAALIIAPHGGTIEVGTSEIAELIAGDTYSFFCFEGHKPRGLNRGLHITSHLFDHPQCLALAARHAVTLGVHGCRGESQVFVGGLDTELAALLAQRLRGAGFPATTEGHAYPGRNPLNVCNRNRRGRGAQLEFTRDFREPTMRSAVALVVRDVIAEYAREICSKPPGD